MIKLQLHRERIVEKSRLLVFITTQVSSGRRFSKFSSSCQGICSSFHFTARKNSDNVYYGKWATLLCILSWWYHTTGSESIKHGLRSLRKCLFSEKAVSKWIGYASIIIIICTPFHCLSLRCSTVLSLGMSLFFSLGSLFFSLDSLYFLSPSTTTTKPSRSSRMMILYIMLLPHSHISEPTRQSITSMHAQSFCHSENYSHFPFSNSHSSRLTKHNCGWSILRVNIKIASYLFFQPYDSLNTHNRIHKYTHLVHFIIMKLLKILPNPFHPCKYNFTTTLPPPKIHPFMHFDKKFPWFSSSH